MCLVVTSLGVAFRAVSHSFGSLTVVSAFFRRRSLNLAGRAEHLLRQLFVMAGRYLVSRAFACHLKVATGGWCVDLW